MRKGWSLLQEGVGYAGAIGLLLVILAACQATATATPTVLGGGQIAFASDRDGNFDIYVMNADGTDVTRLTNDPAKDLWPAWAPWVATTAE